MKRGLVRSLAVFSFTLVTVSAYAQASRTWVSGVGDDVNPCSRTAPCKTFAGAISKTATNGIIDVLDPGGFGGVTITKPMTIEGNGTLASILVSGVNGVIVNIPGVAGTNRNVVLRNLLIDGVGSGINGIRFLQGDSLIVEDSYIRAFTTNGIDFEPNSMAHLGVRNTSISYCGNASTGAGIFIAPSAGGQARASIENTQMRDGHVGLRAEDNAVVTVFHSVASGNTNNGFLAISTSALVNVMIDTSVSSGNGTNGMATSGSQAFMEISNCNISGNVTGINQISGHLFSFHNNQITGNTFDGTPAPNSITQQ